MMSPTFTPLLLLSTAILLGTSAAALLYMRSTGWKAAWLTVASGLLLLAISQTFFQFRPHEASRLYAPEFVALAISLLLFAGILQLGRRGKTEQPGHEARQTLDGHPREAPGYRIPPSSEVGFEGLCTIEHGKIVEANEQLAHMLGCSHREIVGREMLDLVAPDSRGFVRHNSITGYKGAFEFQAKAKDGTLFPAEARIKKVSGAGRELHILAIRDLSARKEAEERLRESEESYRELTDSISDVFFSLDRSLRYTHWNKASEYLTGISARDAIGRNHDAIFPGVLEPKAEEMYVKALKTQQPQRFEDEFHTEEETRIFEISAYPSRRGLSVFARDITARKKGEVALRESEERFRDIYEKSPIGILLFNADGDLFEANEACLNIFSVPGVAGLKGMRLFDDPQFPAGARNDLLSGETVVYESFVDFDTAQDHGIVGSVRSGMLAFDIQITPLGVKERNSPTGYLVQVQDTTERKIADQQLRASLDEKEALLKEIHHRVKNNLQIVSSLLNLQSEKITNKKALDALQESQSRVRSMALIHEQLYRSKDLARINFGQYIRDLTAHLFRMYNVHANNVRLALHLDEVILEIDKAIPCGMIINELVSNCLKHAFEGRKGGHITITVRVDEGRRLAMSVADDGSGFPAHVEFPSTTSLGLRLVQMLTDQLKGSVAMDRTNGTMFTILFPIP